MLYFYASNRITAYLPPDGIFQPMVLVGGIGMVIVALFNLITMRRVEHDCCGSHDHANDCDHAHSHDAQGTHAHSHSHAHHDGCCGHDHHHHDHSDHTKGCAHEDHADSTHGAHGHHGEHSHSHAHVHSHGMLEDSGITGRIVAISILAVPLSFAAIKSPDEFSYRVAENKGLYNPNYSDTSRADEFSLKKSASNSSAGRKGAMASTGTVLDAATTPADSPPRGDNSTSGGGKSPSNVTADTPPGTAGSVSDDSPGTPAQAQSYGSFTLADLEAQVPKSAAGNFILDVPEIYYTGGDIEVQSVLKGQSVETIAQVLPEKINNDNGHRLRIFRMLVQCCAADARPYSIPVDFGKKAPDYKEMTWVKVIGKMNYRQEGGQTVPVLEATAIEETTAPDQSMIY